MTSARRAQATLGVKSRQMDAVMNDKANLKTFLVFGALGVYGCPSHPIDVLASSV